MKANHDMRVTGCIVAALLSWATGSLAQGQVSSAGSTENFDLGRLFFTPAARSALEKMRWQAQPATLAETRETSGVSVADIAVEGLVSRNGTDTRAVWINGRVQLTPDADPEKPYALFDAVRGPSVPVYVPAQNALVELKVGQRVDTMTGTLSEYSKPADAALSTDAAPEPHESAPAPGDEPAPRPPD